MGAQIFERYLADGWMTVNFVHESERIAGIVASQILNLLSDEFNDGSIER